MRSIRVVISVVALIAGAAMVGLSLMAVSQVSTHGAPKVSARRLYIGQTILPDHVLYPAFMAVDRVRLELSPPSERVQIQVEYAQRRWQHAQKLLEKGETALALTTLTKSQKYLFNALEESHKLPGDKQATRQSVQQALASQCQKLQVLQAHYPELDSAVIGQLVQQGTVLAGMTGN